MRSDVSMPIPKDYSFLAMSRVSIINCSIPNKDIGGNTGCWWNAFRKTLPWTVCKPEWIYTGTARCLVA